MKSLAMLLILLVVSVVSAQQQATAPNEKRVSLNEAAVAMDATGGSALEATLTLPAGNGTVDNPITNIRLVIRNSSMTPYLFVSGVVTFYDASSVRCGESVFKAEVVAPNESFETDTPGIRIRCTPTTWRIVATSLVPRVVTNPTPVAASKLSISVDGESHPLQLEKPLTLTVGDKKRVIVVREIP